MVWIKIIVLLLGFFIVDSFQDQSYTLSRLQSASSATAVQVSGYYYTYATSNFSCNATQESVHLQGVMVEQCLYDPETKDSYYITCDFDANTVTATKYENSKDCSSSAEQSEESRDLYTCDTELIKLDLNSTTKHVTHYCSNSTVIHLNSSYLLTQGYSTNDCASSIVSFHGTIANKCVSVTATDDDNDATTTTNFKITSSNRGCTSQRRLYSDSACSSELSSESDDIGICVSTGEISDDVDDFYIRLASTLSYKQRVSTQVNASMVDPCDSDDSGSDGLSDGELAGIIIGTIFGAALIVGCLYCCLKDDTIRYRGDQSLTPTIVAVQHNNKSPLLADNVMMTDRPSSNRFGV